MAGVLTAARARPRGSRGSRRLRDRPPLRDRVGRAGNTIYIAGHIARNDQNEVVGVGDVERQAEQVFQNIGRVLEAAGASFDDIVKINIYGMKAEYRLPILAVRDRFLKPQTYASTYIVPQALASPDLLLEIEAVAVVEQPTVGR